MFINFKVKNIFIIKIIIGGWGYKLKNLFLFYNVKLVGFYFNIYIKNFIFLELNNEK